MDNLADAQLHAALFTARAGQGAPDPRQARTPEQIRETAREFEAVFLAQVLEAMMGESTQSSFGGGPGEAAFSSMLNEEYAKVIAKAGGIGLADSLAREMLRYQEADQS
ncbi:chemotactic signal-response protein chel [Alkalicaulis satelles]|uniref:Chemotactic signal-response protein chel n=1 Tax=Alkalicaulis satelles TaxID=2609175 RepID=A0A5M6ZF09_9PROT|nr:rod-binding protein [Alkalicaulis satelles]KAA5803352.1 chemotactic signal-response protein chel [Alkalicaulis satelles]